MTDKRTLAFLQDLATGILRAELRRRGYFVDRARTWNLSFYGSLFCDPECPGYSKDKKCRYSDRLNHPGERCPARKGGK